MVWKLLVRTHLGKYGLLLGLLFICLTANARKIYTEIPTLIHLAETEQDDTFGFNLVQSLPSFLYDQINKGKIKLWDSPKKQLNISAEALKNIEASNQVSFAKQRHIFFNELWTSNLSKTEFVIMGISFLTESKNGKISLGYIDLSEALLSLSQNYVPCNVNGPAKITYLEALYSRRYQFNLLQFGKQDFSQDPVQSFRIKKDAFYSKKKVEGVYQVKQDKLITYVIEPNDIDSSDAGTLCIQQIESYLNDNKEILFNLGGNQYFDYQNRLLDIRITRMEVTEIWTQGTDKSIHSSVQSIRLFANNKPLQTIAFADISKWQLLMNFKTLEDILQEKTFQYHLYKINQDLIPYNESDIYIKALKNYYWTKVSYYVKYSRE